MTVFIALAGVLVLLALLVVVLPLLRGAHTQAAVDGSASLTVLADEMRELQRQRDAGDMDAAEYEQERAELERQALQADAAGRQRVRRARRGNRVTAALLAVVLPVLAVGIYSVVGTPAALNPSVLAASDAHISSERAVAALEQRLQAQPDDAQGWILLGRSYAQLGRLDDAASAFKKAVVLDGDDPDLLIEYANVLAMSRGRDLTGEPEQLIQHALDLDPDHLGALTFAGLAAFQHDDTEQALTYWHHLVDLLPEDSEGRKRIEELIARTESEQAQGAQAGAASASQPAASATITGSVTLAPELADQVEDGDTLYIFARAPEGPPMPVAAVRARAGGWPVAFQLDDSSSMLEGMKLSGLKQVTLVARVSRQGSATAQAGDLEGTTQDVAVGSQDATITIDRVVQD